LYDVLLDPKSLPETDLESRTAAAAGRNGELYDRQLAIHDEARRVGRAAVNNAVYAGDGRLSGRPAGNSAAAAAAAAAGVDDRDATDAIHTAPSGAWKPARPPARYARPHIGRQNPSATWKMLSALVLHTRSRPPPLRLASAGASRDDGRPYLGPP